MDAARAAEMPGPGVEQKDETLAKLAAQPDGRANSDWNVRVARCLRCKVLLAYPSGATFVQCADCHHTMLATSPNTHFFACPYCQQLLSHPSNSRVVRCPECSSMINSHPSTALFPKYCDLEDAESSSATSSSSSALISPFYPKGVPLKRKLNQGRSLYDHAGLRGRGSASNSPKAGGTSINSSSSSGSND